MQKAGWTNNSFFWSNLAWSGLEKAFYLLLWSLRWSHQQPFFYGRGNLGMFRFSQMSIWARKVPIDSLHFCKITQKCFILLKNKFVRFTRLFSLATLSSIWQKVSGADAFAWKIFFRFLKVLSQCSWLEVRIVSLPNVCGWFWKTSNGEKFYSDWLELVGGPVFAARGSLRIFDCRKERTFLMVNPPLALH